MDVGISGDDAFWLSLPRSLAACRLADVEQVIASAHQWLKDAIATVFTGASLQRRRTHFTTNLLTEVPRSTLPWVVTKVHTVNRQPSAKEDGYIIHTEVGLW